MNWLFEKLIEGLFGLGYVVISPDNDFKNEKVRNVVDRIVEILGNLLFLAIVGLLFFWAYSKLIFVVIDLTGISSEMAGSLWENIPSSFKTWVIIFLVLAIGNGIVWLGFLALALKKFIRANRFATIYFFAEFVVLLYCHWQEINYQPITNTLLKDILQLFK